MATQRIHHTRDVGDISSLTPASHKTLYIALNGAPKQEESLKKSPTTPAPSSGSRRGGLEEIN